MHLDLRLTPWLRVWQLLLVLLAVPALPVVGQPAYSFLVAKGQRFTQGATGAPTPLASGGAVFDAEASYFGSTFTSFLTAGPLILPDGATRALNLSPDGTVFQFTDTLDTPAALDSAYPTGHYVMSITLFVTNVMTGGIDLPSGSFPAAPQIVDFSAAQAVDPTHDFNLQFQPFAGAADPDEAVLDIYTNGTLLTSYVLNLTDTNVTVTANTLNYGQIYEGRLRFRQIQEDLTAFPIPAFGFFSETRFPLITIANPVQPKPPALVEVVPGTNSVMPSALGKVWFTFSEPMGTNLAIQWSATSNGLPVALDPASFTYGWSDPLHLTCGYALQAGGWPSGLVVTWTLSPIAGNTSNFVAANGLALPVNTYSGSFLTAPGPCNCPPPASPPPDWASDNPAGGVFAVTVTDGTAPFAVGGIYILFTSPVGNSYTVLGPAGAGLNLGTYTYIKTGTNSGTMALVETPGGASFSLNLFFGSATAGTLSFSGAGRQHGAFTLTSYAAVDAPELFLPGLAGGPFQSWLSGQPGAVYAIEVSTNLANWQPWQTLTLSDLTAPFSDVTAGAARFYRARFAGTAFAPPDLTNQTLNLTINAGAPPLATNGIAQWMAGTNDLSYQLVAGTGTTDGAGTYEYTATDANRALLSYTDTFGGGLFNAQLIFTGPEAGYFYLTNGASPGYEAGTFTLAEGPVEFLGNVRFTLDTAHAGALPFPADGSTPGSLSVTNAAGWVWTVDLPADALTEPQTITMTPFATVDDSQSLLPISQGVAFGPDGLEFCDGVTFTVRPPGPLGTNAVLWLADGDGSDLQFVAPDNPAGGLSTTLFHFSSGGHSDPSDAQWRNYLTNHLPKAKAAYIQATNAVTALITNYVFLSTNQAGKHLPPSPPPPAYFPWTCAGYAPSAAPQRKVDGYIKAMFTNETAAIKRLKSAAGELMTLETGLGVASTNVLKIGKTETNLVQQLIGTNEVDVVNRLLARYYNTDLAGYSDNLDTLFDPYADSKKFMALYKLSLSVTAQDKAWGGKADTNWPSIFKAWSKDIRDSAVKQVHDNHLYSQQPVALGVETFRNTVMNIAPDTTGKLQTKLLKALTFQLSVDINLAAAQASGGTFSMEAQGDTTVKAPSLTLNGSGTMNYLSGTAIPSVGPPGTLVPGQSFAENPTVVLTPCPGTPTATISLDRLGAATETWEVNGYPVASPGALQGTVIAVLLADGVILPANANGPWAFTVPLLDGQAEAVNSSFELPVTGGGGGTLTLNFTLAHTPQ